MILNSYIYIPVSDLERAAGWYGENLLRQRRIVIP